MNTKVITRFAPSPTGFLHIGGARTALFNWLFARHHGGEFRLRIEDTDRTRSTQEAIEAIHDGLRWLGLDADGEIIYQSEHVKRHVAVVQQLLASGHAYKCFTQPEELAVLREEAQARRNVFRFQSPWREKSETEYPNLPYVVRLKAPRDGIIRIVDQVQGEIKLGAGEVDDVVLLRSDGTPTYMLAVVTDDHDMGVTHIIRGDDHLTNSAKQQLIYEAMGWDVPVFAHVPLIHGPDGAKLSKRHGALGVDAYRDMGYLPQAMRNYLLRLGWASGDDEIFTRAEMIEKFSIKGIGKSPSRFDFDKLANLNGHYIREATPQALMPELLPFVTRTYGEPLSSAQEDRLQAMLPALKERAKTLIELAQASLFLFQPMPATDEKAQKQLSEGVDVLREFVPALAAHSQWNKDALFAFAKDYAAAKELKLGKLMSPVRVAITGSTASPSMFEVMEILGKDASLQRLNAAIS